MRVTPARVRVPTSRAGERRVPETLGNPAATSGVWESCHGLELVTSRKSLGERAAHRRRTASGQTCPWPWDTGQPPTLGAVTDEGNRVGRGHWALVASEADPPTIVGADRPMYHLSRLCDRSFPAIRHDATRHDTIPLPPQITISTLPTLHGMCLYRETKIQLAQPWGMIDTSEIYRGPPPDGRRVAAARLCTTCERSPHPAWGRNRHSGNAQANSVSPKGFRGRATVMCSPRERAAPRRTKQTRRTWLLPNLFACGHTSIFCSFLLLPIPPLPFSNLAAGTESTTKSN